MANYKPISFPISTTGFNGSVVDTTLSTTTWNLALLFGVINSPSGTALASGTLLGWYTSNPSAAQAPDFQTFTDTNGQYGITVATDSTITLKFYSE